MSEPYRRYQYVLAERLGYTVGELRQRMTFAELRYWIAHDRLTNRESER